MKNENDMVIEKQFAEIKEIDVENENCIRIRSGGNWKNEKGESENYINFQIRVKNPLTGRFKSIKKQKERNLIADVSLSISEIKQILEYAENLYKD
jgi:hypothetical protein